MNYVAELTIERDCYQAASRVASSEQAALTVICDTQGEKLKELAVLQDVVNEMRERITDYKVEIAVPHSKLDALKTPK